MSRKVKGKKRNPLMSSSGLARTGVTGGADIRRGLTWGKSGKLTRVCKGRSGGGPSGLGCKGCAGRCWGDGRPA